MRWLTGLTSQSWTGSAASAGDLARGGGMERLRPEAEWGLHAAALRPSSTPNSLRRQLRASESWDPARLTLPGLRPPDLEAGLPA